MDNKNLIISLILFQVIILIFLGFNYSENKVLNEKIVLIENELDLINTNINSINMNVNNIANNDNSNYVVDFNNVGQIDEGEDIVQQYPYSGVVLKVNEDSFEFKVDQFENDVHIEKNIVVFFTEENLNMKSKISDNMEDVFIIVDKNIENNDNVKLILFDLDD